MKNINKLIQQKVSKQSKSAREASAGGRKMEMHGVSDPRFSRAMSKHMFEEKEEVDDDIEEAQEHMKPTYNPNKGVKSIRKGKKKGNKKEKRG